MRSFVFACTLLALGSGLAPAGTYKWTAGTGTWSGLNNTNWSQTSASPFLSNVRNIDNGGTAVINSGVAGVIAVADLSLGTSASGSGNVAMNGGLLTCTNLYAGKVGTGSLTQSGGTNTTTNLYLGYNSGAQGSYILNSGGTLSSTNLYVGNSGTGTFTQNGGTNTSGTVRLGVNSGSLGTYNLNSGTLNDLTSLYIGDAGSGVFNQSGGTNTSLITMVLGSAASGNGSYNLSGSGVLYSTTQYLGASGTGTITQTGGTNTAGSLVLANKAGSTGTYNLNGGTLEVSALSAGSGTAAFNFGAGTLKASTLDTSVKMNLIDANSDGAADSTVNTTSSLGQVVLRGELSGNGGLIKTGSGILILNGTNGYTGGTIVEEGELRVTNVKGLGNGGLTVNSGTVDLCGNSVTITSLNGTGGVITDAEAASLGRTTTLTVNQAASTSSAYAGTVQDGWYLLIWKHTLALTKTGQGTLTLSGANTYTGATTVAEGKLVVNGLLNSNSLVTVKSGATLAGSGIVGTTVVENGATLSPGNSAGTLKVDGDLTLGSGAILALDLATPSTSDRITVTGTLFLDGLSLSNFDFNPLNGEYELGVYTLIEAGALQGVLGDCVGLLDGLKATLSLSGNNVVLSLTPPPVAAVVPEPASLVLLACGGVGLCLLRRRRRASR